MEPGFELSGVDVLKRLPIALLIVAADGEIVVSSGVAEEALSGGDSLAGIYLDSVLAPLTTLLDAPRSDASISVAGPDGKPRRYGYSISDISLPGSSGSRFAIVFRDITQAAHVSSERDRLVHLAAVGAAAPAVIHQVKNSLAAMTMGLGLLAEELEDHDQELSRQADELSSEAESVAYRLDAFGAASRPPRSRRAVDLQKTLDEARRALDIAARKASVRLDWKVGKLRPVYLDPGIVHAFALDLGTNAIQASAPDQRVELSVSLDGDTFTMVVDDQGVGMTPEVLAKSTELFYTTRGRGKGIGLTLVDQAVRAGGGTLDLQSMPGRGTRVTLSLPRATEFER